MPYRCVGPAASVPGMLDAVVAASHDAIVGNDLRGNVTMWSGAAERLFGFSAAEIVGQTSERIVPDTRLAEARMLLATAGKGQRIDDLHTERLTKSGALVPVCLTLVPIMDEIGRVVGVAKTARDLREDGPMQNAVTRWEAMLRPMLDAGTGLDERLHDERSAEVHADLLHLSRLNELGHLVAALAHEVNQPLAAISNYAGGLRRRLVDASDATTQALERITEQAERARSIVLTLRDLARRGERSLQVEDLRKLIDDTAALALAGTGRAIGVTVTIGTGAERVVADRVQVQQVLFNLMRNAVEAMASVAVRTITITASRRAEMVEIEVADTGPGFPEMVLQGGLRPFVTTKPEGLGVGLSICRTIVVTHGGTLEAVSLAAGGAVVRFSLPADQD